MIPASYLPKEKYASSSVLFVLSVLPPCSPSSILILPLNGTSQIQSHPAPRRDFLNKISTPCNRLDHPSAIRPPRKYFNAATSSAPERMIRQVLILISMNGAHADDRHIIPNVLLYSQPRAFIAPKRRVVLHLSSGELVCSSQLPEYF